LGAATTWSFTIQSRDLTTVFFHQTTVVCGEIIFFPRELILLYFPNLLCPQVVGINLNVVISI